MSRKSRKSKLVQCSVNGSNFDMDIYVKLASTKGAINLSQGAPNYHGSKAARTAASNTMLEAKPEAHQYSPTKGHDILRDSIRRYYDRSFGWKFENKNVLVTSGTTEALLAIFMAYCDPGDEVIYFDPFFPWYARMANIVGAVNVVVPMKEVRGILRPDFDLLEERVTEKTKFIIWNTPHNPAGFVASKDEIITLGNIVMKHDLLLISDEVYEAHTFPSLECEHLRAARFEGLWERTITLGSASKMFSLTGWRVGWAIGPEELLEPLNVVHGTSTFCAPTPLQLALAHAFDEEKNDGEIPKLLETNFFELSAAFKDIGLQPLNVEGGHFLTVDIASSGLTGIEFTKLLAENGVIVLPLNWFCLGKGSMHKIRVALCKKIEYVQEAAVRIRKMKTVIEKLLSSKETLSLESRI